MSVEVATTGPGRAGTYTGRTAWARNVGAPVRDFLDRGPMYARIEAERMFTFHMPGVS